MMHPQNVRPSLRRLVLSPAMKILCLPNEICYVEFDVHPGNLTWNLQITQLERKMIFQTSMIMFQVNLEGCKLCKIKHCIAAKLANQILRWPQ